MKKILLSMMALMLSVGAWAVEDVDLLVSDVTIGWSGGAGSKSVEENSITINGSYASVEWDVLSSGCQGLVDYEKLVVEFYEDLSSNGGDLSFEVEYDGADKNETRATANADKVELSLTRNATIKKVVIINAGSTTQTLKISRIYFKSHKGIELSFNNWTVESSALKNNETKTFTFDTNWNQVAKYTFDTPLNSELIESILIFFSSSTPSDRVKVYARYTGDENDTELGQIGNGVTQFSANISETTKTISQIILSFNPWEMESGTTQDFVIEKIYLIRKTVNTAVSSVKYSTFSSSYPIDFSQTAGLTAYIAKKSGDKMALTEVTKVPANEAVILYADVDVATNYTLVTTDEATDDVSDNELKVSDGTVTGDASTIYVLANKSPNGVGFYLLKSGSTVTVGKAYLRITSSLSAPAREYIGFGDGNTTGMEQIFREASTDSIYYTLHGQRVDKPNKGLYIVNGKKVIIK